ncbi:methyltransferase family protein [Hoeflea prorocentri]|uniref:Isoprenylcysteine carboxylmethyltransferase family protein n=1 Tax=Hoeflea prorocentri TaxID=1922333 RepID=A0A9X3UHP8_9HYPH|nr:isoprenylcysteine carboxylmethyltransferase family protein [Hoeflea prorocentri]MCY6380645.1 isoprenylcysteine carboxylmethyltransferase family protein [Hoeflea prorocentri]MDA5398445.1 isoprenylcysteine carboxylmethyltransferase family protein [Hoeflea prorocentri]
MYCFDLGGKSSGMNAYRARPSNMPWPPIITAAAAVLAVLFGMVVTLPLPDLAALRSIGVLFVLSAIGIDVWAALTLRAAHTTILPTRKSNHLVTTGPFAVSRNPIYCGYLLFLIGLGLIFASAWFLVFAAAAALIIQRYAIEREELHLLAVFGAEFEAYCSRVRRWL